MREYSKRSQISFVNRATVAAQIMDLVRWGVIDFASGMSSTPLQIADLRWRYARQAHPFGYVAGDSYQIGWEDPLGREELLMDIDPNDKKFQEAS